MTCTETEQVNFYRFSDLYSTPRAYYYFNAVKICYVAAANVDEAG